MKLDLENFLPLLEEWHAGGPSSRLCYDVEVITGQRLTARIPAITPEELTVICV